MTPVPPMTLLDLRSADLRSGLARRSGGRRAILKTRLIFRRRGRECRKHLDRLAGLRGLYGCEKALSVLGPDAFAQPIVLGGAAELGAAEEVRRERVVRPGMHAHLLVLLPGRTAATEPHRRHRTCGNDEGDGGDAGERLGAWTHRPNSVAVEHLHGRRLVAGAGREEAAELFPRLLLARRLPRLLQRLRSALRRHERGEVGELLRL